MQGLIHHIEINVSNLQRSVDFWSWLLEELGYQPFQKWDGGQSWIIDKTYIVFVQTDEKFLNHLAFYARSRQQVDDLTKLLKQKGVRILYEDRHPYAGGDNHYAVFFEDPDRIKVELVAP